MWNGRSPLWIARSSPRTVARGSVTARKHFADCRVATAKIRFGHTSNTTRSSPRRNRATRYSQSFPPESAIIPVSSAKTSTGAPSAAAGSGGRRRFCVDGLRARRRVSRVLYHRRSANAIHRQWRPFLWDARCRAPPATDPGGGAKVRPMRRARIARAAPHPAAPTWSCSRWGFPCRRRCRQRGALLPHHFTLAARRVAPAGLAVYFLWHCPWGRPRRALPGTVPPWSPDFPLPHRAGSGRPAVWQC